MSNAKFESKSDRLEWLSIAKYLTLEEEENSTKLKFHKRAKSSTEKPVTKYFNCAADLEHLHKHIIKLGHKILQRIEEASNLRIESDVMRILKEYVLQLNEEVENYQIAFKNYMEEEFRTQKIKLENNFEALMIKIEKQRDDLEEDRIKKILRKVNDEHDEVLKNQWKDAEDLRKKNIEHLREQIKHEYQTLFEAIKTRDIREALEKATQEFKLKEMKIITKIREECETETRQQLKDLTDAHNQSTETLLQRYKELEEKFNRERKEKMKIEEDFRLLQTDYKRFIDYTGHYSSDYMMKLRHIGEMIISDHVYEEILDKKLITKS